tara:strand:+ start:7568 stop:8386 length:819 start_codon:yes stop_codon:yes gene_type:complete
VNNLINIFFIILILSIPVLYRFIRSGSNSIFYSKGILLKDENYKRAEFFRFIQVIIGFFFLLVHSFTLFGLGNLILFLFLSIGISFIFEIVGIKTGITFGGYFNYDIKSNGPIFFKVPIFIILTWYGLIYMSFNYVIYIFKVETMGFSNSSIIEILTISFFCGLFIMLLDLILDPIGVDEKRWLWQNPGVYYGVPYLNFLGWFLCCFITVFLFLLLFSNNKSISFDKVNKVPLFLFTIIPIIASRPCFERNLKFPGYFGLFYGILLNLLLVI